MKKIAIVSLFVFLLGSVSLAVPHEINYQGVLKDSSGSPVTTTAPIPMRFVIYDGAGSGATDLWSETQSVTVEAGLYSVRLGLINPIDPATFEGSTRYLGVKVGTDQEMEPRIPLISVPYAFRAEQVGGLVAGDFVRFGTSASQETSEKYGLYVKAASANNDGTGVFGETNSPGGLYDAYGVRGLTSFKGSGTGAGVFGESEASTGTGVLGVARHFSGTNYGVYGQTNSNNGYAGYFQGGQGIYADGIKTKAFIITGDYTLKNSDSVVFVDTTTKSLTVTLPPASSDTIGRIYYIYKADSSLVNTVSVATSGQDKLNGKAPPFIWLFTTPWSCARVVGHDTDSWIANLL
jgi:hypothetical protein